MESYGKGTATIIQRCFDVVTDFSLQARCGLLVHAAIYSMEGMAEVGLLLSTFSIDVSFVSMASSV